MAYYRTQAQASGGATVDFSSPDLTSNFTLSSNGTKTITVTKKPKYILMFSGNYGSSVSPGYGEADFVDVQNSKGQCVRYYTGGASTTSTYTNIFTTISASQVVVKNTGTTYRRFNVAIWY